MTNSMNPDRWTIEKLQCSEPDRKKVSVGDMGQFELVNCWELVSCLYGRFFASAKVVDGAVEYLVLGAAEPQNQSSAMKDTIELEFAAFEESLRTPLVAGELRSYLSNLNAVGEALTLPRAPERYLIRGGQLQVVGWGFATDSHSVSGVCEHLGDIANMVARRHGVKLDPDFMDQRRKQLSSLLISSPNPAAVLDAVEVEKRDAETRRSIQAIETNGTHMKLQFENLTTECKKIANRVQLAADANSRNTPSPEAEIRFWGMTKMALAICIVALVVVVGVGSWLAARAQYSTAAMPQESSTQASPKEQK